MYCMQTIKLIGNGPKQFQKQVVFVVNVTNHDTTIKQAKQEGFNKIYMIWWCAYVDGENIAIFQTSFEELGLQLYGVSLFSNLSK